MSFISLPALSQQQVRGQKGANEADEVNLVDVFFLLNSAEVFFLLNKPPVLYT